MYLRQGTKLKGSNVYINEHLTQKNADIVTKARLLKEQGKTTWTVNCRVFIKPKDATENAKGLYIRSIEQLEKYIRE